MAKPARSASAVFAATLLAAVRAHAAGGVATDGSLGPAQTLSGADLTIPQNLGRTVGANLFHSFSFFGVATGQTVTFAETVPNSLDNVIARVTGGARSDIDGLLRSTPGGHADFYLINPAGVAFGPNARIDVPADFHVSTADVLKFPDGAEFRASASDAGGLSAAAPAAFGFLGATGANNGLIAANGAQLTANAGKTLDIVAGAIRIDGGAQLNAPAGEIRLAAISGTGDADLRRSDAGALPLPAQTPATDRAGDISLDRASLDAGGDGGGRAALWGGKVSLIDSRLHADNTGDRTPTPAQAVELRANSLSLARSEVGAAAFGAASAPPIDIDVAGDFDIAEGGLVVAETRGAGSPGELIVRTGSLKATGAKTTNSIAGIVSLAATDSGGPAGDIAVSARGPVEIADGAGISSLSFGSGTSGDVALTALDLKIDGRGNPIGAAIASNADSGSDSATGQIRLAVRRKLEILDGGYIQTGNSGAGDVGSIAIEAGSLRIDGQGDSESVTGIFSSSFSTGRAGSIAIRTAGATELLNSGTVFTATTHSGDAGDIDFEVGALRLDRRGSVVAATAGAGRGGDVRVLAAGRVALSNGGQITALSAGSGDAGNLSIEAGSLRLEGQDSRITAETGGSGRGGRVQIATVGDLAVRNRSRISSSALGGAGAGDISLRAGGDLIVDRGLVMAIATENSAANVGNISIAASKSLNIANDGIVSASNLGTASDPALARPGSLRIAAAEILIEDSHVNTRSEGNVAAGHIALQATRILELRNSNVVTSSEGPNGDGGDILVRADALILDSGLIQANANGGFGGDIFVDARALVPSGNLLSIGGTRPIAWTPGVFGFNVIQAASKAKTGGMIDSTAPQLNLSGVLANFGAPAFDISAIAQNYCAQGGGSSLTRQGRGGLPEKTARPGDSRPDKPQTARKASTISGKPGTIQVGP